MEQHLVDPRLLNALNYLKTWSVLTQDEQALVKKLSTAFTALDTEETVMEVAVSTVGAFMIEMRSVGLSARDLALAETMAHRLAAGKSALASAERTVAEAQTSMDEVGRICPQLCTLMGRLLPLLPAGQWLPQPAQLRLEVADLQHKQAGVAESIVEMRAALTQMEMLTVEARSITFAS